jgi:FlaA1/EpsC-like NDP-sugar epimerase
MVLKGFNIPRWLIFTIDILICIFSIVLAYLLRFNFDIPAGDTVMLPRVLLVVLLIRGSSFLIARTYAGIIRYTSTGDAVRIAVVSVLGTLAFSIINVCTFYFFGAYNFIPWSIVIMDFMFTAFLLTSFRILVKITYLEINNPSKQKTAIIIFGAGEAGVITKRALDRDAGTKYKVIAFVDDDPRKAGKSIEDIRIYHSEKLDYLLANNAVDHLIIASQTMKTSRKQEIIEVCLTHNTKVLNVPPVSRWINGELSFKQIKKIKIEDLLERDEIKLDEAAISREIVGKRVLITGAAGSIGSEMVRQIARFNPLKLLLIDQAETPLYNLELELAEHFKNIDYEIIICDINHTFRMERVFQLFRPEVIYHAAAYKHVPMMENNPVEAVLSNIRGTKTLADLAVQYHAEKFVMISTDKAVNPTSVMGASKRIAEIYTQSLNKDGGTKFITTRFGNVLGSNGSVIPLFKSQIEKGGPVTITHPEITRFFMTIPEACQLVLEASALGKGGEIFIFDMGKSVKIVDLAKKMIKLSRLELGKDIQITFTGLRPGEKLYEELLADKENTIPTHHPQIMVAQVRKYDASVRHEIGGLITITQDHDNFAIVKKMKEIVPEYKSQNSIYEKLDN